MSLNRRDRSGSARVLGVPSLSRAMDLPCSEHQILLTLRRPDFAQYLLVRYDFACLSVNGRRGPDSSAALFATKIPPPQPLTISLACSNASSSPTPPLAQSQPSFPRWPLLPPLPSPPPPWPGPPSLATPHAPSPPPAEDSSPAALSAPPRQRSDLIGAPDPGSRSVPCARSPLPRAPSLSSMPWRKRREAAVPAKPSSNPPKPPLPRDLQRFSIPPLGHSNGARLLIRRPVDVLQSSMDFAPP